MYEKYLILKNEKFFRLDIKIMTLNDLYSVLIDPNISCCFIVFKRDNFLERFKLEKPSDLDSFLNKIDSMIWDREESFIDSDSFDIFEAEYVDCYPI